MELTIKQSRVDKDAVSGTRWIVLGLACTAFFVTFLDRLAWASANIGASASLGIPLTRTGAFVSAFYVAYVVSNAVGGVITDRIGPRRALMATLGSLAAATALFGFVHSVTTGLILQALMGACAGADYAACIKVVAAWFEPSERGRAMGALITSPSAGILAASLVFPRALTAIPWRVVYWLLGGMTLLVAVACGIGIRDAPRPAAPPPSASGDLPAWHQRVRLIAHDRLAILIALAGVGANWGTWGFVFWANALMVRAYGLTLTDAGVVTTLFGLAAVVSKPLIGWLSDRLGERRWIAILDLIGFATMLLLFGRMTSKTGFLVAAPLLGATAVAYSPLLATMMTEAVPATMTGTAMGLVNAFWQTGSAVVPIIVGMVFEATASFRATFIALAIGPCLGVVCLALVSRHDVAAGLPTDRE